MSLTQNWNHVRHLQFSKILLASTHDSTSYTLNNEKSTQTLNIKQQLAIGITSFDVNISYTYKDGFMTNDMKFCNFIIQISDFLYHHPQEMIELRLRYGNDVDINKLWKFINHPALNCEKYIMHRNQIEYSIAIQVFINRRLLIWSYGDVGNTQFYDGSTWFRSNMHTHDHVCKIIDINISLKNPLSQYHSIEYTLSQRANSARFKFLNLFECGKSSSPSLRRLNSKLPYIKTMKFDYSKAHVIALDFVESNELSDFCMQYNISKKI